MTFTEGHIVRASYFMEATVLHLQAAPTDKFHSNVHWKSIIHREHNHIIDYDYFPDFKIVFWDENAVTMEEGETFRKCFPFYSFDCSITVTSLFHQVRPDQREH